MCCSSWACNAVACAMLVSACQSRTLDAAPSGAAPALSSQLRSGASAMLTPIGPAPGPDEPTASTRNPHADDLVAAQEGRILFTRYNCAGCHGDHGGGGMGPSLRDPTWLYGSSA